MKGLRGIIIFLILVALLVVGSFYITGRAVSRNNIAAAPVPVKPVAIAPPSYCTAYGCKIYNATSVNWKGNTIYAEIEPCVIPTNPPGRLLKINNVVMENTSACQVSQQSKYRYFRDRRGMDLIAMFSFAEDAQGELVSIFEVVELCAGQRCPSCTPTSPIPGFFSTALDLSKPAGRYLGDMNTGNLANQIQVLDLGTNKMYDPTDQIMTFNSGLSYHKYSDQGFTLAITPTINADLMLCDFINGAPCQVIDNSQNGFRFYGTDGEQIYWLTENHELKICRYRYNSSLNECYLNSSLIRTVPLPPSSTGFYYSRANIAGNKIFISFFVPSMYPSNPFLTHVYDDSSGQGTYIIEPLLQLNGLLLNVYNQTTLIGRENDLSFNGPRVGGNNLRGSSLAGLGLVYYIDINNTILSTSNRFNILEPGIQSGSDITHLFAPLGTVTGLYSNAYLYMGGINNWTLFQGPLHNGNPFSFTTLSKKNQLFLVESSLNSPINPEQVHYMSCA